MATAVAVSLLFAALTAAYFIHVNLKKFIVAKHRIDGMGAAWSLALAVWFAYAAAWVLMHAK